MTAGSFKTTQGTETGSVAATPREIRDAAIHDAQETVRLMAEFVTQTHRIRDQSVHMLLFQDPGRWRLNESRAGTAQRGPTGGQNARGAAIIDRMRARRPDLPSGI